MNKIRLFLISGLILSATFAHAQKDDKPALLTVTSGLSYADYVFDDNSTTDMRSGFFVGIRKDIKIIPMLHFNTGLLYTQQGALIKGFGEEIEVKTSYIDIPVGLKFKIGPVFATGGISGNIKVGDNFDDLVGEGADSPELKGFDWVYSIGLGAKISIFSLDFRWNNSFGDIVKDRDGSGELKNSYFLIGLGVSLHKK